MRIRYWRGPFVLSGQDRQPRVDTRRTHAAARRLPEALTLLCLSIHMPNARFTNVLSRLEAAVMQLEALARAAPPFTGASAENGDSAAPELQALAERHRRLRAGTAEALARLDRLIAGGGEG